MHADRPELFVLRRGRRYFTGDVWSCCKQWTTSRRRAAAYLGLAAVVNAMRIGARVAPYAGGRSLL
jgi:hypothetical protein